MSVEFLASDYIQQVEVIEALRRHRDGEIEIVPLLIYPINWEDCPEMKRFHPLPLLNKSWRDYEQGGDWRDALYPIGNGLKQAIDKARARKMR